MDNHLLVINKPANMLSQRDRTGDSDLQSLLKQWLKEKYQKPGDVFLGLVQRLDRPTRGLMVLARTSKAAARLSDQIRKRSFLKEYLAVVVGKSIKTGDFTHYLDKDASRKKSIVSSGQTMTARAKRADSPDKPNVGKQAELNVIHLETRDELSLVKITMKTGRFHQIRAQLAAEGAPVAGDRKYGAADSRPGELTRNLALMCCRIAFEHPTRREPMNFSIGLPQEFPWDRFRNS